MKTQTTITKEHAFKENNKKLPFYSSRLLLIILLCALATGIVPQAILSCIILGACLLLFGTKQIYLAFPVMLFYYAPLGQLAGMSVYRYFTIIFLLIALSEAKNLKIRKSHILPFFIFAVYSIVVVSPDGVRRAVFAILDIFCVLILINHYLNKQENLRRFFSIYVLTALLSFVTGLLTGGTIEGGAILDGKYVEIVRYIATFEDPNYMGFFFTVAVFALLTLKLFSPKLRILLIITIYAMMLSTLSITMIVVNALLWPIYLFVAKKFSLKTLIIIAIVLSILVGLYFVGLSDRDLPVLGNLSLRIKDKLGSLFENDLNDVTSNRTGLVAKHWEYFTNQKIFKMLIGMNAASTIKTSLGEMTAAAHNEYVDLLLNIGIIGFLIYFAYFFLQMYHHMQDYKKNKASNSFLLFMIKWVWLTYAMTLTMFGDYRFMFFFFL